MISTLQDWVGSWKELKQWCLQKISGGVKPSGVKEGGVWYDETAKKPYYYDGTDARLFGGYTSSGVSSYPGPEWTDNGSGSITMASCKCRLYTNPNFEGDITEYTIPEKTFQLVDGMDSIIIAHYNGGTPEYRLVDALAYTSYNLSDACTIYRMWYAFGEVHSATQDSLGLGLTEKQALRLGQTMYYARIGNTGLEPSLSGLTVIISQAGVWAGPVQMSIPAYTSDTDVCSYLYKDAGDVWHSVPTTTVPNLNYNPPTGLETLSNSSKYTVVYIYRTIGDVKESFLVLDTAEYNSEANASESNPRTDLPRVVTSHAVLCGRVIIHKEATTATVESAWTTIFNTSAGVTNHNDLAGKDGGDGTYFGHNTAVGQALLDNAGSANGVATLNSVGVLPISVIPESLLGAVRYQGTWNASTNTPTLSTTPDATTKGYYYVVNAVGTWGGMTFSVGDWVISNGSTWERVDNVDAVNSVFGRTGAVTAQSGDYTATQITSTATGDLSSTNVQAALTELDSEKLDIVDVECLRSNVNITGGGAITYSSGNSVRWGDRFIIIANGRGSNFAPSGYFDIFLPAVGTIITGTGGAVSQTVTSDGVYMPPWTALYYILPIGSPATSVPGNFRIVGFNSNSDIPSSWVLLALRNDNGILSFTANGGFWLRAGESMDDDHSMVTLINGKQNIITGAATTIDTENLAVNMALISDSNGKVATHSSVSSTELGYIDGLSSNAQTQFNDLKNGLTTTFWNGAYIDDSNRYIRILSIAVPDTDNYHTHKVHIGKSFYGDQHYLNGSLFINQGPYGSGASVDLHFVGSKKASDLVYIYSDANNLVDVYLYAAAGSGSGLLNSISTKLLASTKPSSITLYTSGTGQGLSGGTVVPYIAVGNNEVYSNKVFTSSPAQMGPWSYNGAYARFGHNAVSSSSTNFGVLQDSNGVTFVSGPTVYIRQGNSSTNQISVSSSGITINGPTTVGGDITIPQESTTGTRQIKFTSGDNDSGRLAVGATASNAGWLEIATADDGNEPIYARQYSGDFSTVVRTATLLDGSGNTSFPGTVTHPTPATSDDSTKSATTEWVKDVCPAIATGFNAGTKMYFVTASTSRTDSNGLYFVY